MPKSEDEELLDTRAAARYLGVSPRTIERWRITGDGPEYVLHTPRCVRYRPTVLREWVAMRSRRSTSDSGARQV